MTKSASKVTLLAFVVSFLALFAQFPLAGRLPGNTDSLLALALSNVIVEKIRLLLAGEVPFTSLYPATDVMAYGENCYGLAAMFIVFKLLTRSDVWAYYFFITSIFALNAFALSRLASLFVAMPFAVLAGVVFTTAGFTLGNIDDPNVVFVFFPAIGLFHLFRGVRTNDVRELRLGLLASSVQIWFGMYFFIYQFAMVALFSAIHARDLKAFVTRREMSRLALVYALPALPLILLYVVNQRTAEVVSPYEVFADCSMRWSSFLQRLPDNLLYPAGERRLDWVEIRKNAFPGLLLPLFSLTGAISARGRIGGRAFAFLIAVSIGSFVLSFGSNVPVLGELRAIPYLSYLRVPSRFYLVTLMILSIFFAIGVEASWRRKFAGRASQLAVLFSLVVAGAFVAENVPFPLFGYEYRSVLEPSETYERVLLEAEQAKGRRLIVLDLPSTTQFLPSQSVNTADRMWFFTREVVYMNWQTYHRQIIVGGANGYVSKARMEVEGMVRRLPERESLADLRKMGVDLLVFHKGLVLFPDEEILVRLKTAAGLKLVQETEREAIFEIDI